MSNKVKAQFGAAAGVFLFALSGLPLAAQDIEIPAEIRLKWTNALKENLEVMDIDPAAYDETGKKFEALVRRFMDPAKARKVQAPDSEGGTVYTLFSNTAPAVFLSAGKGTPIKADGQVPLIFKKAKRRFSFVKFLQGPGGSPLGESESAQLTKTFLQSGGLLGDRGAEGFWKTEHTRVEVEGKTGGPRVVSQQVRYYRQVGNRPVFNAGMTVRFHPGSWEILAFKLANWGRVRGRSADQIRARKMASADEFIAKLRAAQAETAPAKPGRELFRKLTDVELGYYEIDDTLVPGFLCRVESRVKKAGSPDALALQAFFIALNGEMIRERSGLQSAALAPLGAAPAKRKARASTGAGLKRRNPEKN